MGTAALMLAILGSDFSLCEAIPNVYLVHREEHFLGTVNVLDRSDLYYWDDGGPYWMTWEEAVEYGHYRPLETWRCRWRTRHGLSGECEGLGAALWELWSRRDEQVVRHKPRWMELVEELERR